MINSMLYYFLLFLIYAFAGWIMEVILFLVKEKKFINRGFLIGPYCPIYGFCAVLMVLTFDKLTSTPFTLFIMAAFVCTFFEYITSYIMEKLFNARWWDYSQVSFNINGRVCLHNSILFGLLGLFLIYIANPFVEGLISQIPSDILPIISGILLVLFIIDNIISFNIISRVRTTTNAVIKDNTEEITEKVKNILLNRSLLSKRLIESFPNLKLVIEERLKEQKEKLIEQTEKIKEKINRE